jgi:hypothetical protein
MEALFAILGGGIVAGVAYYIGWSRGFEVAQAQAAIVTNGWKERAEQWRKRVDASERLFGRITPIDTKRAKRNTYSNLHKPQWHPDTVHDALQRTAYGKHVPLTAVEDWSLEDRELAYLWALQVIGGRDMPTPLRVMAYVPLSAVPR